jgi:hypothetical protein
MSVRNFPTDDRGLAAVIASGDRSAALRITGAAPSGSVLSNSRRNSRPDQERPIHLRPTPH